ncbi:MAG: hypothetical protein L3K26_15190, partial [Candidatus Hydrogenedentes bacterium]|nr:hypothetical protein [Candidatus Hydrogenedentota bacterium]
NAPVKRVLYAPSGTVIATTYTDNATGIWDRASLSTSFEISHPKKAKACAFSHDSSMVAAASSDGTVELWSVTEGRRLHALDAQMGSVHALDFSPDGQRLLTASEDGAIRIWDTNTGFVLATVAHAPANTAMWAWFSRDGASLLTVNQNGKVAQLLPMPAGTLESATDRGQLASIMNAHKKALLTQRADAAGITPALETRVYLPQPEVQQFILLLGDGAAQEAAAAVSDKNGGQFPPAFQAGDLVSRINDVPIQEFFRGKDLAELGRQHSANGLLSVDIVRNGSPRRLVITGVAVKATVRSATLDVARASELLAGGLQLLRDDADTILEVNHRYAKRMQLPLSEERDSLAGYLIGYSSSPEDGQVLRSLRLQSGERVVSIADTPVRSLGDLKTMAMDGRRYLESNSQFSVLLALDRGLYETVELSISATP